MTGRSNLPGGVRELADREVLILSTLGYHQPIGLSCSCGVSGLFSSDYAYRCHVAIEVAKVLASDDNG